MPGGLTCIRRLRYNRSANGFEVCRLLLARQVAARQDHPIGRDGQNVPFAGRARPQEMQTTP